METARLILLAAISLSAISLAMYCFEGSLGSHDSVLVGTGYYNALAAEIGNASSSVKVAMFEAKYYPNYKQSLANNILDSLVNASRRGVNVKVIIEGGEPFLGADFYSDSAETCSYLTGNGVDVKFDPENVTTHAKFVIIDRKSVIIGSTNWNFYALERNNEASVLVGSESLAEELDAYFESLWKDSALCTEIT